MNPEDMSVSALQGPTGDDRELALAVVIPCHNVEQTLAAQLDALVGQRWTRPWGIVVVDNRSTDSTVEVARRYGDQGVRVVTADDGRGVAYARNAGARAVRSDAVAFCDGDDVVGPGWVAAIGDGLFEADIVSGQLETNLLNPAWLADSRPMSRPGSLPTFGTVGFASGCNCGVRRGVLDELGGFDESFVGLEDIEFSLRARARGFDIRPVPDAVVSYRFRTAAGDVWRQGVFYGRGRPALIALAKELGLPGPGRFEGLRSWGWLVLNAHRATSRGGRFLWLWVLANRIGVLRGALARRSVFL